jgi:hypothetical protein
MPCAVDASMTLKEAMIGTMPHWFNFCTMSLYRE